MGGFCSKTSLIFAASSINTENITDLNEGQPIHIDVKKVNGSRCRNRKNKHQNRLQKDTQTLKLGSSNNMCTTDQYFAPSKNTKACAELDSYKINDKKEQQDNENEDVTLYDSNGKAVRVVRADSVDNMDVDNDSDSIPKKSKKTRDEMESYWNEHSNSKINKSLMLLMEDNPTFEELERKEILNYLPNFANMDCIELGAGIGRFTNELGKGGVKSLLAIDFMEKFITVNENSHKHLYPDINMQFKCQDVTSLVLDSSSFDFVFSNWLMMYLNDVETTKLAEKMYKWCKYGGYVFFRESCEGGASGDKPRSHNPTHYRKHEYYSQLFGNIANQVNDKQGKLVRVSMNKVKIYVDLKNKTNQYCWLYQKQRK